MITDARQLARLAERTETVGSAPVAARPLSHAPTRPLCAASAPPLPPPENGWCYSAGEVGRITGRSVKTVRDWIACGLLAGERRVRLKSMRVPRGMIKPEDLRRFLDDVNG